jgi:hypothetical protein
MNASSIDSLSSEAANVTRERVPTIVLVLLLMAMSGIAACAGALQAWAGTQVPATQGKLSPREIETILSYPPQRQAEELLQAAVNHYEGAPDLIMSHVDEWRGKIQWSQRLFDLDLTARYCNDLRVRAATTELMLAAYNYPKTPDSVDRLVKMLDDQPDFRPFELFTLALLGNRGVETTRVIDVLQQYANEADEKTQYWAVEGIAIVGTPDTIPMLLRFFHDGKTRTQRERAGCGLAKAGAYTQQERMTAVPALVEFVERNDVDAETHRWHFQAMREITNVDLPDDPKAWRKWLDAGGISKPYGTNHEWWAVAGNS